MLINPFDFGISPNQEITENLMTLFEYLKNINEPKTLVLEKGEYYIDSEKCKKEMLFITNTTGDNEFSKEETPHLNTVGIFVEGIKDFVFDGNGSTFIIDGKASNMALINCENIEIKNLEICHSHPDMHELKVIKRSSFFVDFQIDKDSLCCFKKNKLCFFGKNYCVAADQNAKKAYYIGLIHQCSPNKVERVRHPLASALKIKDLGDNKIRVYYPRTTHFKENDRFYIYDVRRQYVGIFIDRSKNILLEKVKQRFNYSLALVAQDSENISLSCVDFSPGTDNVRKLSSIADFLQFCMCRGKITVKDSNFEGSGDDCINVHGIHFKIIDKSESGITLRFCHPQTHGFNPFRSNDEIAFINRKSLLEHGRARVLSSTLLNEYEILLTLDNTNAAIVGEVVENITACPDLDFCNNTINRIITRGILVTTRGKVNIEGNRFISTTMSGILISDDSNNWFEGGMCKDVVIKNNCFEYCKETPILIKPENKTYQGAVHHNIKIIDNVFKTYKDVAININATDNILISGNSFSNENHFSATNCNNIIKD